MSGPKTTQSPLLRLPLELRTQIYQFIFDPSGWFPETGDQDNRAIYDTLPGICRASQELFYEATPIYLATCAAFHTSSATTSRKIFKFLSRFPDKDGFHHVDEFYIWEPLTNENKSSHLQLLFRCVNLEDVTLFFGCDNMLDGESMDKYQQSFELYCFQDSGLHYRPMGTVDEELARLRNDLQKLVTDYELDRLLAMPKLDGVEFNFSTVGKDGEEFRHHLSPMLWKWAVEVMGQRYGPDYNNGAIRTGFLEDHEFWAF